MELDDSLFLFLREVSIDIDPYDVFQDAERALLIGAKPRGPGMERAGLLDINGQIFAEQEPQDSYTTTTSKDPGIISKELSVCHQELSFGTRRRGSPSLGLGAPGFTFINKLLKESIYLTSEAIRLYRQEKARIREEAKLEEEPEESEDSQQSKRSVFDRIGAKGKKNKKDQGNKKKTEAAKQKKLEEMREQSKKEEESNLELKIQKRTQLEEEKLLAKSRTKRTRKDPTPEVIFDDDEEKQKDLKDMIYEL
ncbi:hypothetical protein AgCh_038700 [Apium graveolens]